MTNPEISCSPTWVIWKSPSWDMPASHPHGKAAHHLTRRCFSKAPRLSTNTPPCPDMNLPMAPRNDTPPGNTHPWHKTLSAKVVATLPDYWSSNPCSVGIAIWIKVVIFGLQFKKTDSLTILQKNTSFRIACTFSLSRSQQVGLPRPVTNSFRSWTDLNYSGIYFLFVGPLQFLQHFTCQEVK